MDTFAQYEGIVRNGIYYAIWLVGVILLIAPTYISISAYSDWMKGRKELGEVGVVIIVGVVVVLVGIWLLSLAQTMTASGIGVGV